MLLQLVALYESEQMSCGTRPYFRSRFHIVHYLQQVHLGDAVRAWYQDPDAVSKAFVLMYVSASVCTHVCFDPTQNPSVISLGTINGIGVVNRAVETWQKEKKEIKKCIYLSTIGERVVVYERSLVNVIKINA